MHNSALAVWPAVAGIALPLILVPTILLLKHSRLKRQWAHQERMEAIRMGVSAPSSRSFPGSASVVAIGAGVPFVAILGAWLTTIVVLPGPWEDPLWPLAIVWGCAFLISGMALVTSLVLGVLQHRACARAAARESRASAKPAHDPDAFDLTGRHAY